jgi:hypothetical protein
VLARRLRFNGVAGARKLALGLHAAGSSTLELQLDEPHLRPWAASHLRGAAQLERPARLLHHASVRVVQLRMIHDAPASCRALPAFPQPRQFRRVMIGRSLPAAAAAEL